MCWTVADTDSDQARFFDDVSWDIFMYIISHGGFQFVVSKRMSLQNRSSSTRLYDK